MERITGPRALVLVREVVAEGPDMVYESPFPESPFPTAARNRPCVYIGPDGGPSCIVARVLVRAGVAPSEIAVYEEEAADGLPWVDEGAGLLLRVAQVLNDDGMPWRRVLTQVELTALDHHIPDPDGDA
jgi:hypothetical protein